jgi:hypothetical protein
MALKEAYAVITMSGDDILRIYIGPEFWSGQESRGNMTYEIERGMGVNSMGCETER